MTDVRGQRGGCQQLSHRTGACFLLNKKEALENWSKWMMMKREKVDKQGVSMVAGYRYLGLSNPGLKNDWEPLVWCFLSVWHPGLIRVYQKNSCTLLFSGLRSSWNLVNPLLSMNEAWMDECAARLQINITQITPNFRNRKNLRFDRNNWIMS